MKRLSVHRIAAFAPLLLAACNTVPAQGRPDQAPETAAGQSCRSEDLAEFVGDERSAALESELLRRSGARTVRWVPEDAMITMEFSPERLTVHLDASGRIERLNCG